MKKAKAIELLKLAVPIKALTQQEYSDFVEAVNMGMDTLAQPEPHGRLIDASYKVDMPFYDDEYEEYSVRTVTVEELLMMADNDVPTVIEAERSED